MSLVLIDGFDRCVTSEDLKRRYAISSSCVMGTGLLGTGKCISIEANNGFSISFGLPTPKDTLSVGFSFQVKGSALSSLGGGYAIMRMRAGGTEICHFSVSSSGQIMFGRASTLAVAISDAGVIQDGVRNHLEITFTRHPTAGSCEIRVNGVVVASATGVNLGASSIDNLYIVGGTGTLDANNYRRYDDLYVNDVAVSIGEARIDVLVPNADTAQKDWTPLSGTDNFAMVGKTSYDDTTYVSAATVGDIDLYALSDLGVTPQSIKAVQVSYTAQKDDVTTRAMRSKMKSGATTSDGATVAPGSGGFQFFGDIYENNPDTSAPWTASDIAALEAGIEVVT